MKLIRFQSFVKYALIDTGVSQHACTLSFYRFFADEWLDDQNDKVQDPAFKEKLLKTLLSNSHWRENKSGETFFPILSMTAVVVGQFISPPKKNTREKFQIYLDRCATQAQHEYEATHDSLTALLNRANFDKHLNGEITKIFSKKTVSEGVVNAELATTSILLIAIDIDYFKQVNDSFGHMYGDIVLKCLAMRLEALCDQIKELHQGKISVTCARPGGEEFYIVASGTLANEFEEEIGKQICEVIASKELPTQNEWERDAPSSDVTFPHVTDRKITVSVGLASLREGSNQYSSVREASNGLLRQADIALYRAKAAGRNRYIRFNDILSKFGRIIEHHHDADIVTIDVGRQVDVHTGQEFIVYHPDFVGDKAFIFADGRTEKRIGTYPLVPAGQIVVFDVQADISFCRVADKKLRNLFPPGCSLKAVPGGTITHLLGPELVSEQELDREASLTRLELLVKNIADRNKPVFSCIFSLINMDLLMRERGAAFVNKTLADLYKEIKKSVPKIAAVGQVQDREFAVASGEMISLAAISSIIEAVKELNHFIPKIVVGYHDSTTKTAQFKGDDSKLIAMHSLDYARYAASARAPRGDAEIYAFSPATTAGILTSYYSEQRHLDAKEDYKAFVELGVNYAYLENNYALACISLGEMAEAKKALLRAIDLAGDDPTFHANVGYVNFHLKDRAAAFEAFSQVRKIRSDYHFADVYLTPLFMSYADVRRSEPAKVSDDQLREYITRVLARDPAQISGQTRLEALKLKQELGM